MSKKIEEMKKDLSEKEMEYAQLMNEKYEEGVKFGEEKNQRMEILEYSIHKLSKSISDIEHDEEYGEGAAKENKRKKEIFLKELSERVENARAEVHAEKGEIQTIEIELMEKGKEIYSEFFERESQDWGIMSFDDPEEIIQMLEGVKEAINFTKDVLKNEMGIKEEEIEIERVFFDEDLGRILKVEAKEEEFSYYFSETKERNKEILKMRYQKSFSGEVKRDYSSSGDGSQVFTIGGVAVTDVLQHGDKVKITFL